MQIHLGPNEDSGAFEKWSRRSSGWSDSGSEEDPLREKSEKFDDQMWNIASDSSVHTVDAVVDIDFSFSFNQDKLQCNVSKGPTNSSNRVGIRQNRPITRSEIVSEDDQDENTKDDIHDAKSVQILENTKHLDLENNTNLNSDSTLRVRFAEDQDHATSKIIDSRSRGFAESMPSNKEGTLDGSPIVSLSIPITGQSVDQQDQVLHTYYEIHATRDDGSVVHIQRRFREFEELHRKVR